MKNYLMHTENDKQSLWDNEDIAKKHVMAKALLGSKLSGTDLTDMYDDYNKLSLEDLLSQDGMTGYNWLDKTKLPEDFMTQAKDAGFPVNATYLEIEGIDPKGELAQLFVEASEADNFEDDEQEEEDKEFDDEDLDENDPDLISYKEDADDLDDWYDRPSQNSENDWDYDDTIQNIASDLINRW